MTEATMKSTRTRRQSVSFKDVQIAYLMDGVSAVDSLVTEGRASRTTVRRALSNLQSAGREVKELEDWVIRNIGAPGRGRSAPIVGESRAYKAQQVKNGSPFLRLPLDVLGVQKGSVVTVTFDNGKIVVSG